ncbi:MAG: hypothetical protein ACI906_002522 [Candidatus Latescibacterota bacterium]|jgi:hypothetical protein
MGSSLLLCVGESCFIWAQYTSIIKLCAADFVRALFNNGNAYETQYCTDKL